MQRQEPLCCLKNRLQNTKMQRQKCQTRGFRTVRVCVLPLYERCVCNAALWCRRLLDSSRCDRSDTHCLHRSATQTHFAHKGPSEHEIMFSDKPSHQIFTHQRHDVASPEGAPPLRRCGLRDRGDEGGSSLGDGRSSCLQRWWQEAAGRGATQQDLRRHRSLGGRVEARQLHGRQSRLDGQRDR